MNTYELIDSGDGEKLERFGAYVLRRPDPQALWAKRTPTLWDDAHLTFRRGEGKTGSWQAKGEVPEQWQTELEGIKMWVKPTPFKHTGVFPEQSSNWKWLKETVGDKKISVLNLFAYTGGATIACAVAGAEVTHVDSSKGVVTWAHENADLNDVGDKIRWIVDDAVKFVERELKRGKRYDGIIMDPPSFAGGKDSWKLEEDFVYFINQCKKLLSEDALFFLINGYASGFSATTYKNNILDLGDVESGELAISEKDSPRVLPAGIFARWKK
jgi:23S rRNA (cytosine1962-C5)-methyltransferase